jgi:hypothetical protein
MKRKIEHLAETPEEAKKIKSSFAEYRKRVTQQRMTVEDIQKELGISLEGAHYLRNEIGVQFIEEIYTLYAEEARYIRSEKDAEIIKDFQEYQAMLEQEREHAEKEKEKEAKIAENLELKKKKEQERQQKILSARVLPLPKFTGEAVEFRKYFKEFQRYLKDKQYLQGGWYNELLNSLNKDTADRLKKKN